MSKIEWTDTTWVHSIHGPNEGRCGTHSRKEGRRADRRISRQDQWWRKVVHYLPSVAFSRRVCHRPHPLRWADCFLSDKPQSGHEKLVCGQAWPAKREDLCPRQRRRPKASTPPSELLCGSWAAAKSQYDSVRGLWPRRQGASA